MLCTYIIVWFPSFQVPIRSSKYFQDKFPKFRPINFDGHKNNDLRTSFSEKEEVRVRQKTSMFEKIVAWLSSFTHSFRRTVSFIIAQPMKFEAFSVLLVRTYICTYKVVIHKSRSEQFLWNRNSDLGWFWADWQYWKNYLGWLWAGFEGVFFMFSWAKNK